MKSNSNPVFHYMAYLLRIWPAGESAARNWRAHLEDPRTGQRQGFSSLMDLIKFLETETGSVGCSSSTNEHNEPPHQNINPGE